jgi:hypothetical protein
MIDALTSDEQEWLQGIINARYLNVRNEAAAMNSPHIRMEYVGVLHALDVCRDLTRQSQLECRVGFYDGERAKHAIGSVRHHFYRGCAAAMASVLDEFCRDVGREQNVGVWTLLQSEQL